MNNKIKFVFLILTVITFLFLTISIFRKTEVCYKREEKIIRQPSAVLQKNIPEKHWDEYDINLLAQMLWGEARGISSDTEKAACVWCVLNRVDAGYGSISDVITAPYQFVGYSPTNPIDEDLKRLCEDVLMRWAMEKTGILFSGRVLPQDYLYFSGYDGRNHFRNEYFSNTTWDWSLPSPYES